MSIKVTMKREPVVIQVGEHTLEISHSDALELWNSLGKILGKSEDPYLDYWRRSASATQQWNPPEPVYPPKGFDVVYR